LIAIGVLLAMTASGSLLDGGAVPASAQLRAEAEHLRATLASERDALARANARAEYALTHDAMTGLLNRHRMNSVLQDAIDAGGKSESGVALCFLDFDEFKKINDTYGHTAGDQFLRLMGDRLRRSLDCEDCIARVGGDEFAVVFENVSDVNDAIVFAKELLSEVAKPFIINGREVAVTASIGIAIWPLHVSDAHGLMFYADQAMYRAKQSGRNTYSVYTASPDGV
jgi:diguanylate cyclase (GGDEF)-like protein